LDGRIIAQAPKADLDFDAAFLIGGPLSVKRFSLIGVQLTGVRSKDGAIHLGFNSEQGAPDILETIHNILKNSAKVLVRCKVLPFAMHVWRSATKPAGCSSFHPIRHSRWRTRPVVSMHRSIPR